MTIEETLNERSGSKCELCSSGDDLSAFEVAPVKNSGSDSSVLLCGKCSTQVNDPANLDQKYWYCLNDSMWSQVPAVQVMAFRLLTWLKSESWAHDLLDQLYLDDETKAWAEAGILEVAENMAPTKDSNGTALAAGDSVTLIKDLVVKGANFTAKRGTLVKNISLTDDPKLIEGRVGGTQIVLVAAFLKKA